MANKKTEQQQLNWVFGAPASPTQGSIAERRSGSIKKARDAGVTRDHPLTPMAQKLAAELAQDAREKESATCLSPFTKKYDIRDGAAHVSPDLFYQMLNRAQPLNELRSSGIHTIHIDAAHINATFTIVPDKHNPPADWEVANAITSRDIRRLGLRAG